MKKVKLSQGKFAKVDNEDYEKIKHMKWYYTLVKNMGYAVHGVHVKGKGCRQLRMHRFIMGVTDPKVEVDHIDGDGLNNQRDNLRLATRGQNTCNRTKSWGKSKYLGVSQSGNRWQCAIQKDEKAYNLGVYDTEKEAAMVRDKKAIELHGEFSKLNFPNEG